jgi:hypothetical protein
MPSEPGCATPPKRPLKEELAAALIEGIRLRGPEAFGSMLLAAARIAIAVVAVALIWLAGWAFGFDVSDFPSGKSAAILGLASWIATIAARPGGRRSR